MAASRTPALLGSAWQPLNNVSSSTSFSARPRGGNCPRTGAMSARASILVVDDQTEPPAFLENAAKSREHPFRCVRGIPARQGHPYGRSLRILHARPIYALRIGRAPGEKARYGIERTHLPTSAARTQSPEVSSDWAVIGSRGRRGKQRRFNWKADRQTHPTP